MEQKRMAEKLTRWFIFGVVVSLLPFALAYLNLWASKKPAKIEDLLSRGELLLVSTAIGAAAIGELLGVKDTHALGKIIVGGCSFVAVLMQMAWYACTSDASRGLDGQYVARSSLVFFAVTLVCSFACLFLAGI